MTHLSIIVSWNDVCHVVNETLLIAVRTKTMHSSAAQLEQFVYSRYNINNRF